MVAGNDDDAVVVESALLQVIEELTKAGVDPVDFIGHTSLETGTVGPVLRFGRWNIIARKLMHIHRLRVKQHRLRLVGERVQMVLQLLDRRTSFVLVPELLICVELAERVCGCEQLLEYSIETGNQLIIVRTSQGAQTVYGVERLGKMRMQQLGSRPNRRFGDTCAGILTIGFAENNAVARERVEIRRVVDARVVRSKIICAHRVNYKNENIWALPPSSREIIY